MNKTECSHLTEEKPIKKSKCDKSTGCCDVLLDRLEENNYRGKGFSRVLVVTREDFLKEGFEPKLIGIKYKTGTKDRGIMLNHCPFCGEKLDWFRNKECV